MDLCICFNASVDYISNSVLQCNSLDFHFLYLGLLRLVGFSRYNLSANFRNVSSYIHCIFKGPLGKLHNIKLGCKMNSHQCIYIFHSMVFTIKQVSGTMLRPGFGPESRD